MKLMLKLIRMFVVLACFAPTLSAATVVRSSASLPLVAQCRGTDTTITKQIRFARGRTTAVVKDTVRLCTGHEYRLKARAGQTMSVHLATGKRTSMTLYAPNGEMLLDGGNDWEGELPETGEYNISIGTDATARYTLEVTIR
jgi:hypothetical protein